MIYAGSVKFYDVDSLKLESEFSFIYGDTYSDALETLVDYYGEEEIYSVKIEACAPDNVLYFGNHKEEFQETMKFLEEEVLWQQFYKVYIEKAYL